MRNVKPVLRAVLTLTVLCTVVVAALAGTNLLTAERIAEQEKEAARAACEQVISADSFEEKPLPGGEGVYYEATAGGALAGYVFSATVSGKSSGLTVMTGVGPDGKVTGVAVTENNETAGYVDKVRDGGLFERLVGTDAGTFSQVDGVSQATRTSGGVKKGVEAALAYFREVTERG